MEARQWARQWTKLMRQEAELGPGPEPAREGARAPGQSATAPSLQHIRTQLNRQLAALESLRTQAAAGDAAAPVLERRQRQCAAALADLASACAAQLHELERLEAELSTEYEAAAKSAVAALAASSRPAPTSLGEPADAGTGSADGPNFRLAGRAAAPASTGNPPEVAAYDAFLQRHGPTGGWHPDDHAEFERILRACKGSYSHAVQLCCEQLALLHSADDVAQHARWHEDLQRLALAKRLAVQRWRLARQAEQSAMLDQPPSSAGDGQQHENQAGAGNSGAAAQEEKRRREQEQKAVADWKAAREREREAALRRQQEEERERRQREDEARQRRQDEARRALERHRADKAAAEASGQLSAEGSGSTTHRSSGSSFGSEDSAVVKERLRERNQQLLEKRAAAVRRHSQQADEQAQRVEQLARQASEQLQLGGAERDPSRLLRATSAAALRQLAALAEERTPRDSGYVRHLPRRATPGWCSGARLH